VTVTPLIIDTDPGVDDAFAIAGHCQSRGLPVRGDHGFRQCGG
jgi:inosine-uridine nucleoside N-ribohydrolase